MKTSAKWMMTIGLISLLIALYFLRATLAPFFVAAVLAYLFDPIVNQLQRLKLARTVAVMIVFMLIMVIFTLIFLFLLPLIQRQSLLFMTHIPDIFDWSKVHANQLLQQIGPVHVSNKITVGSQAELEKAGVFAKTLMRTLTHSGIAFMSFMTNILLVPVVLFYLLRDWTRVLKGIQDLIPRSALDIMSTLLKECNEVLSAFLRGQFLVMIALTILYSIGLSVMGLNFAVLIGIISGLVSIVPYLGFIVGILVASIVAMVQFQDAWYILYVGIVFLIANGIEGSLLTPWLVGDKIGLHPVAVIFAVLAGGQLFGFVGILLALPVAAVVMVFIRHFILRYKQSQAYAGQRNEIP